MSERPFSRIRGNERNIAYLRDAIDGGTLPHALILCGPRGSGKHTVATELAKALGGRDFWEKIENRQCPDVIYVGPTGDRKTVGVESVRAVREAASVVPNDLECKIFIIEDPAQMTLPAQNALLKLLEEPNGAMFFILLCENPNAVIPTVRSRAILLQMQFFSPAELERHLCELSDDARRMAETDADRFSFVLRQAGGCIGQALAAMQAKGAASDGDALSFIASLSQDPFPAFLAKCDAIPAERDKLLSYLETLRLAFRDLTVLKTAVMHDYSADAQIRAQERMLCLRKVEEAMSLSSRFPKSALLRIDDILYQACCDIEQNANVANTKQKLASELRAAMRG